MYCIPIYSYFILITLTGLNTIYSSDFADNYLRNEIKSRAGKFISVCELLSRSRIMVLVSVYFFSLAFLLEIFLLSDLFSNSSRKIFYFEFAYEAHADAFFERFNRTFYVLDTTSDVLVASRRRCIVDRD